MKTTETIMSFSHNDPAVNPSPPNPRLNYHLAMDKKSRRDQIDFSTFRLDKEIQTLKKPNIIGVKNG